MYVRKKKNKSGIISIQIIDKSSGKYKVIKTIGSSNNSLELGSLLSQGKQWIKKQSEQLELDLHGQKELFSKFISSIQQVTVVGTELLLLGRLFDQMGFFFFFGIMNVINAVPNNERFKLVGTFGQLIEISYKPVSIF
jgi:hypothetical protein